MDDATRKMLKDMDRFTGGHNSLETALRAERLGLTIPFHEITYLVQGRPVGPSLPGPSLKMTVQVGKMPNRHEVDRLGRRAYQAANQAFHYEPFVQDVRFLKCFDPFQWGQHHDV